MRAIEMGKDQAEPSKKSQNCFIYKCRHRTMVVLLICNQRMGVRIPLAALQVKNNTQTKNCFVGSEIVVTTRRKSAEVTWYPTTERGER